jgi:hypothetical protein
MGRRASQWGGQQRDNLRVGSICAHERIKQVRGSVLLVNMGTHLPVFWDAVGAKELDEARVGRPLAQRTHIVQHLMPGILPTGHARTVQHVPQVQSERHEYPFVDIDLLDSHELVLICQESFVHLRAIHSSRIGVPAVRSSTHRAAGAPTKRF